MTGINLLPWREALRKRKQQQYVSVLSLAGILACAVVAGVYFVFDLNITNQNSRNAYLQKEMVIVNAEIREIKKLKEKKMDMIERVNLVRNLQNTRPVTVHLFDEIARSMPDDLYLTEVSYRQSRLTLKGIAKNNQLIAALIRQLEDSQWLEDPNLTRIETVKSGDSQFEVSISLEYPNKQGGKK